MSDETRSAAQIERAKAFIEHYVGDLRETLDEQQGELSPEAVADLAGKADAARSCYHMLKNAADEDLSELDIPEDDIERARERGREYITEER